MSKKLAEKLFEQKVQGTPDQRDFEFIEYFKKAMANSTDPDEKRRCLVQTKVNEAQRDYFIPSLRQINHLVQIDEKPLELKEPRCEIYKISLSFRGTPSKS